MRYPIDELMCMECGKGFGFLYANDLEGSYFFCSVECSEIGMTKVEEKRVKRAKWEEEEMARRAKGDYSGGRALRRAVESHNVYFYPLTPEEVKNGPKLKKEK